MNTMPVPLYLVSGFLGSGKTSFIKSIIEKLGANIGIGIVQNEFSSINIDSRIISETNKPYALLEVNKGSVFCLCLLNNFIKSLSLFIDDHRPEAVFIEASGLSDPVAILQMINSVHLSDKVRFAKAYTIVDGLLFKKQVRMFKSVVNQLRIADCALINKCDKIGQNDCAEIAEQIRTINPFCNILTTEYSLLNESETDEISSGRHTAQAISNLPAEDCNPLSYPPDIKIETISTPRKISTNSFGKLEEIVKPLLRVKGFLRAADGSNWTIQSVCGDFSINKYNHDLYRTEIVLFGEGKEIDATAINKLFLP